MFSLMTVNIKSSNGAFGVLGFLYLGSEGQGEKEE